MIDDLAARVWRDVGDQWAELRRVIGFWEPLATLPPWMAPAAALGALLALAVAGAVALASLGALLTALLVAYVLLERVFGVSIALTPPR